MENKKVSPKNEVNKVKPVVTPTGKKDTGKKPLKKSSALLAASKARSALGRVGAHSSKEVRGSSGLANTGTIISYD